MAKHTGITVRIGAAYDEVRTPVATFDRADMRKNGAKIDGRQVPGCVLVNTLNREVVNAYSHTHNLYKKDRRRKRRERKQADRDARS